MTDKYGEVFKFFKDNEQNIQGIGKILGKGAFGEVRDIKYKGRVMAGKLIEKEDKEQSEELSLSVDLRGNNIIKTNKIISKQYRGKFYDLIIMDKAVLRDIGKLNEFYHNHNLLKLIFEKPFDESAGNYLLRFYAKQVIRGYDIFDRNDFGHFDIKPENLLVTINLVIKLSDFSLLKILKDNMKLPGGTQGFMTQEYYVEKYFSKGNAKKQDYFALGSCLFILKYGIQMLKFKKYDDKKMCADRIIDLLQRNIMFIKTKKESDKDFKDFLISLIQYKPEQRPSFEQIYRNKWLNKDSEELNHTIMAFESDEEKLIMELQKKDFLIKVEKNINKSKAKQSKFSFKKKG